jgi:hypothetical protein
VYQVQRRSDLPVAKGGEPAASIFRQPFDVLPNDLDEHQFGQFREDRFASGAPGHTFLDRSSNQARKPAAAVGRTLRMKFAGQRIEERIERAFVAAEVTAGDAAGLTAYTPLDNKRKLAIGGAIIRG